MTPTAAAAAQARETVRRRLRLGGRRLRLSGWGAAQSALAGALAWEFASRVLGHTGPFFAAVAGIVCLSTSYLNRMRRVVELAVGVTVGVGIGDLVVGEIGRGGWQLGLVVLVAMLVALLLDGAPLIINQAGLQAVFVTALPPPAGGYVARWVDALVGGATALVVAFALPSDPRPALRRAAAEVVHPIADALRLAAEAARVCDVEQAADALEHARATGPAIDRWRDAVAAAVEVSRLSPLRRHARGEIEAHRRGLDPVDRAVRNVRVALRRVVAATEDEAAAGSTTTSSGATGSGATGSGATGSGATGSGATGSGATGSGAGGFRAGSGVGLPAAVVDVLDGLATAFYPLSGAFLDPDGEGGRRSLAALTDLTSRLRPDALALDSMHATVVVAQIRSAVVDLLQVAGMPAEDARARLPR